MACFSQKIDDLNQHQLYGGGLTQARATLARLRVSLLKQTKEELCYEDDNQARHFKRHTFIHAPYIC